MSGYGSHVMSKVLIAFKVQNSLNAIHELIVRDKQNANYEIWLPHIRHDKAFPKSRNEQIALKISYNFSLFVFYDCHSYHRKLNLTPCVQCKINALGFN